MRTVDHRIGERVDEPQCQWQGLLHVELYGLYGYPPPATKKAFSAFYEAQKVYKFKAKQKARKAYKSIRRAILEAGDL